MNIFKASFLILASSGLTYLVTTQYHADSNSNNRKESLVQNNSETEDIDLFPPLNIPPEYFDNSVTNMGAGAYSVIVDDKIRYQSYPTTDVSENAPYSTEVKVLPSIKSDEEIYRVSPEEDFMGSYKAQSIKDYGDLARRFVGFPEEGLYIDSVEYVDVTGDGSDEQIISLTQMGSNVIGAGHIVVKDNQIIFESGLTSFSTFTPAENGKGFLLEWDDNYKKRDGFMLTKFIYDNEKFVPVYEQQVRYVRINNDLEK